MTVEPEAEAEEIFGDLYARLVGAFGLLCGDGAMAEDLAQEALARLWERWPTHRRPDHPMAWCYRVGVNLAVSAARRRTIEHRILPRLQADARAVDRPETLTTALVVRAAVLKLPVRERQAVVARHYLSLSVQETAHAMGCAPGTVTALTHQGIAKLRRSRLLVGPSTCQGD